MHVGGMQWLMSDDIMTEKCARVRILCMVRCERLIHSVRSIKRVSSRAWVLLAYMRLGTFGLGVSSIECLMKHNTDMAVYL